MKRQLYGGKAERYINSDPLDEENPLYTEVLMKEPTKFYVLRTYRHKAIRKSDRTIVTADCPVKPIAKSYASASLLADLMID